jgi:hypothetical protein
MRTRKWCETIDRRLLSYGEGKRDDDYRALPPPLTIRTPPARPSRDKDETSKGQ